MNTTTQTQKFVAIPKMEYNIIKKIYCKYKRIKEEIDTDIAIRICEREKKTGKLMELKSLKDLR